MFDVNDSGSLARGAPTVTEFSAESGTAGPFSFDFDENGVMVLNHANSFTVASYRVEDSGALTQLDEPLAISGLDDESVLAFGGFNCWIVIHNGIAYVMTFGDIPATSLGLPDGPGVISAGPSTTTARSAFWTPGRVRPPRGWSPSCRRMTAMIRTRGWWATTASI